MPHFVFYITKILEKINEDTETAAIILLHPTENTKQKKKSCNPSWKLQPAQMTVI